MGITNKAYVRDFFNRVQLAERGYGSGVIYDKSGLIVTNNHVVDGASEIIVSLADGRSAQGKVLGTDAATDLAVSRSIWIICRLRSSVTPLRCRWANRPLPSATRWVWNSGAA